MHDPNHKKTRSKSQSIHLTARSLDLLWRTLSSLLSYNSSNLSLCCRSGTLRLLGLLCALCCGTLLLSFLDSGCTGSGTGFGSLGSSLLDHVERGTDDGTLRLDCAAGSLLGNFLLITDKLASRSPSINSIYNVTAPEYAIPQRYPSCVVFGTGRSMQYDEGSCAAGRGIRSFHFGIGRSCYHHERKACPVNHIISFILSLI
jgi:hypothetical protein